MTLRSPRLTALGEDAVHLGTAGRPHSIKGGGDSWLPWKDVVGLSDSPTGWQETEVHCSEVSRHLALRKEAVWGLLCRCRVGKGLVGKLLKTPVVPPRYQGSM